MPKPIWIRLKNYKCPFCDSDLLNNQTYHKCPECSFKIGDKKLVAMVQDMSAPKKRRCGTIEQIQKTQEELSKL